MITDEVQKRAHSTERSNIPSSREFVTSRIRQVVNGIEGFRKLRALKNTESPPSGVQLFALLGLQTLVPSLVEKSGILTNPKHREIISQVFHYLIAVNDAIDFQGSKRSDLSKFTQAATKKADGEKAKLFQLLGSPEFHDLADATRAILTEVDEVERWVRDPATRQNYENIRQYREVVNALETVLLAALILKDPDLLENISQTPEGTTTIEQIRAKYNWVFDTEETPSAVQNAVKVMYNVAMAMQVDDDRHGYPIDHLLKIPSFVVGAAVKVGLLGEKVDIENKRELTEQFLKLQRKKYANRAKQLGLTPKALDFLLSAANFAQKYSAWQTEFLHSHPEYAELAENNQSDLSKLPEESYPQKLPKGMRKLFVKKMIESMGKFHLREKLFAHRALD